MTLHVGEVDPEDSESCAQICESFDRIVIYVSPYQIMNALLKLREEKMLRIDKTTLADHLRYAAYRGLEREFGG